MTDEKIYTENDLRLASEMGALTRAVTNLCEKVDDIAETHSTNQKAMWERIDKNRDKIEEHSALIKWIIGIGIGLQIAWGVFMGLFKH